MQKLFTYALIFGLPIVAYAVWLRWLTKRLHFLLLLAGIVVTVWLALWPLDFAPAYRKALDQPGDAVDAAVNGFVLMGWIPGAIGCLPILLVEIPRSVVLLMRKRRGD
ncbi:hypothetical protein [Luteolibacter soli]|uniref:MFS transporter n=1 Tax=Luteolibacter soli TaxID=3135280 RepID=A0ABU9AW61_9BACT